MNRNLILLYFIAFLLSFLPWERTARAAQMPSELNLVHVSQPGEDGPVMVHSETSGEIWTDPKEDRRTFRRQKELIFDAEDLEYQAQLANLVLDEKVGVIRLDRRVLMEDDAPGNGIPEGYNSYRNGPVEWVEDLKEGIVVRKQLQIDRLSASEAQIIFQGFEVNGNTSPLHISVNGTEMIRPATRYSWPKATQYIDWEWDRWYYVDISPSMLKEGLNDIRMWSESDSTSWRLLIAHEDEFSRGSLERTTPPGRSMKSRDNGRTWSESKLGAMDEIHGEYTVRLSLNQHIQEGEYVSPVIDLVDGENVLKTNIRDLSLSISANIEEPAQTRVGLYARLGETPFQEDGSWTSWQPIGELQDVQAGRMRFVQLKAELETADPSVTPSIRNVRIDASWEDRSPNSGRGLVARVENNGEIVRSSYPFSYEDLNHPGLDHYRTSHKLDEYLGIPESEFELMMRLLNWAYKIPLTHEGYSWNWNDVTEIEMHEGGMPLMNGPFEGRRMVGMCLFPNQALIGALLSKGFQARHVNLHSEGLVGHEAVEVWSNEYNKWIYLDATRDYYYFDPETGEPLNLLELHNLLAEQMPSSEDWREPFGPHMGKELASQIDVGMRQGENDYSIEPDGRKILQIMGHFRIIPRNDFLSNPHPVPVRTGATMWGWDGFLNWYDETFPKRLEYQRQTSRPSDFYEPLNQAKVYLTETDEAGLLQVQVDTYVPGGFDTLLVRFDGNEWQPASEASWYWNLDQGHNRIEVRTRNVRGVLGPVSELAVNYNP